MGTNKVEFKTIRNKIKTYDKASLVRQILLLIARKENNERWGYWPSLHLLAWTLKYAGDKYPSKNAEMGDLGRLYKMLEAIEYDQAPYKFSQSLRKAFSSLVYQQYHYQVRTTRETFSRQYALFKLYDRDNVINEAFSEKMGIQLSEYIGLLFFTWLYFHRDEFDSSLGKVRKVESDFYRLAQEFGYEIRVIRNFISSLTISEKNIHAILKNRKESILDGNLHVFQVTPFARRPFLFFNDKYLLPVRHLLNYASNHFLFDFLKSDLDNDCSVAFGKSFEEYVRKGIEEAELEFLDENDLRKRIGNSENVVDFVLNENILIEVKSVALGQYSSVSQDTQRISRELKGSVSKAYSKQMMNVANKLKNSSEYFGIVISYKELLLGNSTDMWEDFLKERTEKFCQKHGLNKLLLPCENLFFMDIRTWDRLLKVTIERNISIQSVLKNVRAADKDTQTKTFLFDQHLDKYGVNESLGFLQEISDKFMTGLKPI